MPQAEHKQSKANDLKAEIFHSVFPRNVSRSLRPIF